MKHILKQFTQREADPHIQFIKYAIAGGIATAVDLVVIFLCGWLLLPTLRQDEFLVNFFHIVVPAVTDQARSWHFYVNSGIAFLFSNTTAYLIDFNWVFHPGRHSRRKEITLFFCVSLTALTLGAGVGSGLIYLAGAGFGVSIIAKAVAALAINYAGRKFLVFSR